MPELQSHWLAALAFVAYLAMLLWNAMVGRRESKALADYFVGGRRMGGLVLGASFFATFASTNSYIGNAGKGYAYGLPWMTLAVLMVLFTGLSWRFVAPRMRRFTAATGALTVPEYLIHRFPSEHRALRTASAVIIVASSLLYLLAVFKGAGHLFQLFFDIPYEWAVGLVLAIVVAYTSAGGFYSVVRTDVVQGLMMMLGSIAIFWFVTQAAGGVGALVTLQAQPKTEYLFTANAGTPFIVLLGVALAGSLKLFVDPRQISRFYALRDERSVRQGMWVALIGIVVIQFCLFPVGLYAHGILDNVSDTDLIVPTLLNDPAVFPLWVSDLLLVAILAAAMSSLDSVLLVAASTFFKDLLLPLRRVAFNAGGIGTTRICVVAFALLAALLALQPPAGIVEITTFSGSLYAVCFLPPVLLGLYWKRGDAFAVVSAMIAGVTVLLGWLALGWNSWLHEVFPALAISTGVYTLLAWHRAALPPDAYKVVAAPVVAAVRQ
ncbi:MAG: sodium:solute symporter family transporter [Pseudomonadales bacterium]